MRRFMLVSLLIAASACGSTEPAGTVISVRLRDDAGAIVKPTMVLVTVGETTIITTRTSGDGTVDIDVGSPGTYVLRVIPNAGYVSTARLTRSVMVSTNMTAAVDFTVYRQGFDAHCQTYDCY